MSDKSSQCSEENVVKRTKAFRDYIANYRLPKKSSSSNRPKLAALNNLRPRLAAMSYTKPGRRLGSGQKSEGPKKTAETKEKEVAGRSRDTFRNMDLFPNRNRERSRSPHPVRENENDNSVHENPVVVPSRSDSEQKVEEVSIDGDDLVLLKPVIPIVDLCEISSRAQPEQHLIEESVDGDDDLLILNPVIPFIDLCTQAATEQRVVEESVDGDEDLLFLRPVIPVIDLCTQVEPETSKPAKARKSGESRDSKKNNKEEPHCPICWENPKNNKPSSTICGHLFCFACIESAVNRSKKCPICNTVLDIAGVHPIFF